MVKRKTTVIILTIFFLIGVIHGLISASLNNLITWILIGFWLVFTIKLFENIKRHREFNSPHNTAFFVIIPLLIGVFYSIWGSFTGILGENLISGSNLYFSFWSLIFGLPFVIYGSHSLYRCLKKYRVIYFGTKSVKARGLGFILAFSIIFFIIIYWIGFYNISEFFDSALTPLHFSLDLNLLVLLIISIFNLFIFGFLGKTSNIPELTRDYIARRTRRINDLTTPRNQTYSVSRTQQEIQTPATSRATNTSTIRNQASRISPNSQYRVQRTKTSKNVRVRNTKSVPRIRDFNKFKPKGSFISEEDFKCIFCFKLPKLPEDKNRGVVLCPNCKHPAHADEFKDWMQTSNLCSRCSAPISSNYRRNPKVISVKNYSIIYRYFLKKK
jgi:hypothetical protein